MAQFLSKPFGMTPNGEKINEYIISNPGGLAVSVLNYGCIIKNIWVPTKRGPVDVVLGHDTYADYVKDFESSGSTCCGAFVGRYANRIENAVFNVGGKTYQLEANNGKNHLHGTFPRKLYEVKTFGDTLLLEAESPDGEDGFPGNLKISVRYILTEDNALRMDYRVSSDADTIINLTNHTYFNLDGGGDVLGQKLRIYASRYLEGNNETCPTGNILPVAGTPMDFRAGKPIGRDIDTGFSQTTMVGGGYDHCFVIDRGRGASQSLCAWASSDKTGISMKVYTTQPGVQLYTGNFLQDCPAPGKGGVPTREMAPLTIALGPGFTAGVDVDLVVETKRGHKLGRIIREGSAAPNSGVPGIIGGYGAERVLHAQAAGIFRNLHSIADFVEAGEAVAEIETPVGQRLPVVTQISGILRGLLRDGYPVTKGFKVADVDPRRAELENCFLISDKARCIAGSVLELIAAACWN